MQTFEQGKRIKEKGILVMSSKWHIWVIKQNKFDSIEYFLKTEVSEVEEIFFPTVLKECKVGNRLHKRRVPLFSGYLFLLYADEDDSLFYKIRSNPFVTNYVGVCDSKEVESMRQKEEWNVLNKVVDVGDLVEVISGPFAKCKGTVHSISGNKVTIKVSMFDRSIDYTLSSEDLEIVEK